jgi:hypothetical protein
MNMNTHGIGEVESSFEDPCDLSDPQFSSQRLVKLLSQIDTAAVIIAVVLIIVCAAFGLL